MTDVPHPGPFAGLPSEIKDMDQEQSIGDLHMHDNL